MRLISLMTAMAMVVTMACSTASDSKTSDAGSGAGATDSGETAADSGDDTTDSGDDTTDSDGDTTDSGDDTTDSGDDTTDSGDDTTDSGDDTTDSGDDTTDSGDDTTDSGDDTTDSGDDTTDSGDDTTDSGDDTAGTGDDGGDALTFGEVFEQVFGPQGCTAGYCHGAQAGGMLLQTAEQAYDQMVNAEATTDSCGLTIRVVPGNPEESVLWARVDPEQPGCEPKMPQGSTGLGEEDLKKVYDWIKAGAKP